MKRFNINPKLMSFDWGEMDVIILGEKGRGRYQSIIPYHALKDVEYLKINKTKSNKPKIVKSDNNENWLAVVSGAGCYTRNTYGTVYCLEKYQDDIKIVSKGMGAYGDAGRIGSWNEFLVIVPDNTFLKIRPAGGSYKIPRYWLYFGKDKVFHIQLEELDIFIDQNDIDINIDELNYQIDLDNLEITNTDELIKYE